MISKGSTLGSFLLSYVTDYVKKIWADCVYIYDFKK